MFPKKENQFSLNKVQDDESAILPFFFYTAGFPLYQALMFFFSFTELKLSKMQYWKGQNLIKESHPYQEDENQTKPVPPRKVTFLD